MKTCRNPECNNEFEEDKLYCCPKCRMRMKTILEREKRRARAKTFTHPCKKCGAQIGYKKVYCEACKQSGEKRTASTGIVPLNTQAIRDSRAREQMLIERVVAAAQANNTCANMFRFNRLPKKGVRVG